MLLTTWPMPEFLQFLQIITWIMLPALAILTLATYGLHYYRNWKKRKLPAHGNATVEIGNADPLGNLNASHILFDHSGLIREYQHKLTYQQARYSALKQDYRELKKQFDELHVVYESEQAQVTEVLDDTRNEVFRQDLVIDQLRRDLANCEKELMEKKEIFNTRVNELASFIRDESGLIRKETYLI